MLQQKIIERREVRRPRGTNIYSLVILISTRAVSATECWDIVCLHDIPFSAPTNNNIELKGDLNFLRFPQSLQSNIRSSFSTTQEHYITIGETANHTPTRKSINSTKKPNIITVINKNKNITKEPTTEYQNENRPRKVARAIGNNNVKTTCILKKYS
jgi:hypothetical protein